MVLCASNRWVWTSKLPAERVDVRASITVGTEPFGSIAMTYRLHCLPRPMTYKARGIFDNVYDGLVDLRDQLEARFDDVRMIVTGCVARFAVPQPSRRPGPQALTGRSA